MWRIVTDAVRYSGMTIELRRANVDDAPAIAGVSIESWRAAYEGLMPAQVLDALDLGQRTGRWKAHLAAPTISVFVAVDTDEVIGFSSVRPTRDETADERVGEIPAIYLLESHWRVGVGRRLCERALDEARGRKFEEVTLWVLDTNESARRFYEGLGFHADGGAKTDTKLTGSAINEVRYRITL